MNFFLLDSINTIPAKTETDSKNLKFKFSNDYKIHFYPIKISEFLESIVIYKTELKLRESFLLIQNKLLELYNLF